MKSKDGFEWPAEMVIIGIGVLIFISFVVITLMLIIWDLIKDYL